MRAGPFTNGGAGGGGTPAPDTDNALGAQLRLDLAALQPGGTLTLADGIYQVATTDPTPLNMGAPGATIKAANGARPIITNADSTPPRINVLNGTTLQGLWFGGSKDTVDKPVVVGSDCVLDGCTFFGYYGGIVEGGGTRNHYQGNRFVNCGSDRLFHSIYISNAAAPGAGAVVDGNIFIGGGGYAVHLWHDPANAVITNNFFGACQWCLVLNGSGHVAENNVVWSDTGLAGQEQLSVFFHSGFSYTHNAHGPALHNTYNESVGQVRDANGFVGSIPTFGTNPEVWATADNAAHLGQSAAAIDATVAALQAAFAASAANIHIDTTIEPNFSLLAGVVDAWAA